MDKLRQELIFKAKAAIELERRQREEALLWYNPCGPKHKAFHTSDKLLRFAFGGNRSGKSMLGLTELLFRACLKTHPFTKAVNPAHGRYRIFTTKFQNAEEHIIPLLKHWVPKKWLLGGSWSDAYTDRYHMLKGVNDTLIDILTYDQDTEVAASVECDGIWADEEMPEKMFAESVTRVISRKGRMWLTVTPLYNLTWAMKYWEKTNDPNVDVFKFSIHDNPHLPQKEKEAIIAMWPEHERRSRETGEFLEFGGLFYPELDSQVHFLNESRQPTYGWPVVMSMDPHQRKGTAVTWAYVDPHDDVVFFDELEIKGTADEVVKAIREKERSHKSPTQLRVIDPAANKQISGFGSDITTLREFEAKGMSFSLAYNNEAGYNVVREYLAYDKSKPLDIFNRPRCYFTADVPKTWYSMTHVLWDDRKQDSALRDPREKIRDFQKDFADNVRYTLALRPSRRHQSSEPINLNFQAF